jgi:hypothetical protein
MMGSEKDGRRRRPSDDVDDVVGGGTAHAVNTIQEWSQMARHFAVEGRERLANQGLLDARVDAMIRQAAETRLSGAARGGRRRELLDSYVFFKYVL